jgi:hypothetical protein
MAWTYRVRDFAGPLSIKSVRSGEALWETTCGRFPLRPGSYLVVNDGHPYSLTIESARPVETFCLFFRRGLVEDVRRALISSGRVFSIRQKGTSRVPCASSRRGGAFSRATARDGDLSGRGILEPGLFRDALPANLRDLAAALPRRREKASLRKIATVPALRLAP